MIQMQRRSGTQSVVSLADELVTPKTSQKDTLTEISYEFPLVAVMVLTMGLLLEVLIV